MAVSKQLKALADKQGLTEQQALDLVKQEAAQVAEGLKSLTPEQWEAQAAAVEGERQRRQATDDKAFHKRATENSAEVAKEIMQKFSFDPGWR